MVYLSGSLPPPPPVSVRVSPSGNTQSHTPVTHGLQFRTEDDQPLERLLHLCNSDDSNSSTSCFSRTLELPP